MLKNLIRHEFRATSRLMWPAFAGMLALSIAMRFSQAVLNRPESHWLFDALAVLIAIGFAFGLVALSLAPLALSALRFERHVLKDEGYLTLTLPVSFHKILLSKLLVSAVWYALSFLVLVLACMLAALNASDWAEIARALPEICGALFVEQTAVPVPTLVLYAFELLLNAVAFVTAVSLIAYAAYAVGFSFGRHRSALANVFALAFLVAASYAMLALPFRILDAGSNAWLALTGFQTIHLALFTFLIVELCVCAVFYAVTWHFATKRLNLE